MTRKRPRLKDMIGPDTEDGRPVVMGEPLALDLSTVRRSCRHKAGIAADARPIAFGEPLPLDRSAITYRPRSASGSMAEDGKSGPLVQGETFTIAD